jgi:hypothetical protein
LHVLLWFTASIYPLVSSNFFYMTWKMCIIFRSAYWLTPQTRRKLKWYILYSAWSRHIFVPVPGIRFSTPFVVVYFMFIEFIWGMTVLFVDISLNCWQALCKLSFHKIYLSYWKATLEEISTCFNFPLFWGDRLIIWVTSLTWLIPCGLSMTSSTPCQQLNTPWDTPNVRQIRPNFTFLQIKSPKFTNIRFNVY